MHEVAVERYTASLLPPPPLISSYLAFGITHHSVMLSSKHCATGVVVLFQHFFLSPNPVSFALIDFNQFQKYTGIRYSKYKLKCIGRQIWWYHWAVLGSCIWHLFFSAKHWWGRVQIKSAFFSSRPKFEFKWCWTFSLEMFRWYLRVTRNTTQLGFYEIVAFLCENIKSVKICMRYCPV